MEFLSLENKTLPMFCNDSLVYRYELPYFWKDRAEMENKNERECLNYASFAFLPAFLFLCVVNHCIKYQAKMNYSVRNFEDNLLGCFRFVSVSNKVVKWGAGGHPASSCTRELLSDEILTDSEPKTSLTFQKSLFLVLCTVSTVLP